MKRKRKNAPNDFTIGKNPRNLYPSRPPIKETPPPPSSHSQAQASPGLTPGGGRPDKNGTTLSSIVNLAGLLILRDC